MKKIQIRLDEELIEELKNKAECQQISFNSYISNVLNSLRKKEEVVYTTSVKKEKKEIEIRVYFTQNEAEIFKEYAKVNSWSLTKEIRHRVIGTIVKNAHLNGNELENMCSIKSSINVLGANINRIIREGRTVDMEGKNICEKLMEEIKNLKSQIERIEASSSTRFVLK